jgi:hypothetical protein
MILEYRKGRKILHPLSPSPTVLLTIEHQLNSSDPHTYSYRHILVFSIEYNSAMHIDKVALQNTLYPLCKMPSICWCRTFALSLLINFQVWMYMYINRPHTFQNMGFPSDHLNIHKSFCIATFCFLYKILIWQSGADPQEKFICGLKAKPRGNSLISCRFHKVWNLSSG